MFETVKLEKRGSVHYLTLNRPEKRNAMNEIMQAEIIMALEEVEAQNGRLCVITGAGSVFCAGADLNWMRKMKDYSFDENISDSKKLALMFRKIREAPFVTVAAVNGHAIGGAVGIISACDIAIAKKGSLFSFGEVKLGIVPAVIAPYIVAKTNQSSARYYMLTGERFGADRALEIGLVHKVFDENDFNEGLKKTLIQILTGGKRSQKTIKKLLDHISPVPSKEIEDYTVEVIARARISEEGQEGIAAFFEKRKPNWLEDKVE